MVSLNICGFVFARGGSRGCPGKNGRMLGGIPLIARAVETALNSRWINRVVVSTDDQSLANIAKRYGAEVPYLRPTELAGDHSPEWLAWRHAISHFNLNNATGPLDVFVSIPPVAPLRIAGDIDRCVETFINSKQQPDVVFTVAEPHANPFFSMVVLDKHGLASLAASPPGGPVARRQDAPPVYAITPVCYVVRPDLVLNKDSMFSGRIQTVEVPANRAVDIDTEFDFELAEFLLKREMKQAA